jgi:hypothetical protein
MVASGGEISKTGLTRLNISFFARLSSRQGIDQALVIVEVEDARCTTCKVMIIVLLLAFQKPPPSSSTCANPTGAFVFAGFPRLNPRRDSD